MAFTGEILWSPILNSIKFINSLDDSFLDYESLDDMGNLEWMNLEGYCQKVETGETRTIQFHSNGTTPTVYVKDWITNAIISTVVATDMGASIKEGEDGTPYPFNFYEADLSFPAIGNYYCTIENTAGGTIRSEPINVGSHPNTLLLTFTNRENTVLNVWDDQLELKIRVEAQLFRRNPSSDRTVFRGSDNRGKVLSQRNMRGMTMNTFMLPPYLHEALAYGWSLTVCAINGQSFYSEEGYEATGYVDRYTLSNGSILMLANQGMDQAIKRYTLPAPTAFTATRMTFADVDFGWTSNSGGLETGFIVERSPDNAIWTTVATVGSGILVASASIPSVGGTWYFRVIADGGTPSDPSNVASFATVAAPIVLDAITTVTTTTIDLSWTDTEGFASSYQVIRATVISGPFVEIVNTTNTTFQDTALDPDTEYFYQVRVDGAIISDYSAKESATTQGIFAFSIQSDLVGTSNNDQFTFPQELGSSPSFTMSVTNDTAADIVVTADTDPMTFTFDGGIGTYNIEIVGSDIRPHFNNGGDKLKIKDVTIFGDAIIVGGSFYGCKVLDITATDAPTVISLANTFADCQVLTGVGNWNHWDVSSVTVFGGAFVRCYLFNLDISSWDVSNSTNFASFMKNASVFNQDISGWDVTISSSSASMFSSALALDIDMGGWSWAASTNLTFLINNTNISSANYNSFIAKLRSDNVSGLTVGADTLVATGVGVTDRAWLIANNSMTFIDATP